jgi:hypothetical protein
MSPQGNREKTSEPVLDKFSLQRMLQFAIYFYAPSSKEPKGSRDAELKRVCG